MQRKVKSSNFLKRRMYVCMCVYWNMSVCIEYVLYVQRIYWNMSVYIVVVVVHMFTVVHYMLTHINVYMCIRGESLSHTVAVVVADIEYCIFCHPLFLLSTRNDRHISSSSAFEASSACTSFAFCTYLSLSESILFFASRSLFNSCLYC